MGSGKGLSKGDRTAVKLLLVGFVLFYLVALVAYNISLVRFHQDLGFDLIADPLSRNGHPNWGNSVTVMDLASDVGRSATLGGFCPNVVSESGEVNVTVVDDGMVCCDVGAKQKLIPYRDDEEAGLRHYLCGFWPMLDRVSQPLAQVRYGR
ncbi:hypothetical protein [Ferrimonas marina]|uniref:Uncharacterized protein n=1 Tax=Ferrimonas marina TaxID=299255 RepID=A0A1M5TXY1_9GAMM|nr:hypothetical protein [Ferrimonas marina]SHH55470.1 hypothetical protein SAMN02745129_2319 [Ferrimonas marina]